jgi:hypothetical protein
MLGDETTQDIEHIESNRLYFIETYLRQLGDHKTLLLADALILRNDISATAKTAQLQAIIQGALNGKQ